MSAETIQMIKAFRNETEQNWDENVLAKTSNLAGNPLKMIHILPSIIKTAKNVEYTYTNRKRIRKGSCGYTDYTKDCINCLFFMYCVVLGVLFFFVF